MRIYNSHFPPFDLSVARCSVFDYVFSSPVPGHKVAFIDGTNGSRRVTRDGLKEMCLSLAYGLRNNLEKMGAHPLHRGDVVMIFSPNSLEYPVMLLAAAAAGIRVTLANAAYTPKELAYQYKDSTAMHVFVDPVVLPVLLETLTSLGVSDKDVQRRVVLMAFSDRIDEKFKDWIKLDDLIGTEKAERAAFDGMQSNTTLFLPYSSGTSGLPKGVETTHFNVNSLVTVVSPSEICESDIILAVLPFFHIYGLVQILMFNVFRGATTIILPRFDLNNFCNAIEKFHITFAYVVPPILVLLATHPLVEKFDFSSLRLFFSGAAPLSADTALRAQTRLRARGGNVLIMQGYGLTETSPTSHMMITWAITTKAGSVGRLLPNLQTRLICEDEETDVEPGQPGELWIKGPTVMRQVSSAWGHEHISFVNRGYWRNEKATRASITPDGWFKTGDIAVVDQDGFYFIVDRKKELIKYKGFQVPPAELEGLLLSHPQVEDAAVIGLMSKAEATELPRGYIVPKGGLSSLDTHAQSQLAIEIQEWVKSKVAYHKQLRGGVVCIDIIPKSASGKILRRVLRDMAVQEAEAIEHARL
ncbi:acetyl-CoA synthetase-like protein [Dacryopinax primogenitus]|uniref:Acetyl-CoA synthetase-like protein n=1 Tax=Dacryopinax primogenitus (strain DJM 731) TaxID=1858805 RepID=M5FY82_DACPD|nr:acetyl-CoA synthetase-like protein [Dacryopinax primogenitus]EJT98516.1 acetyl-CoA synthetase-like protein [Dacryopinax primogenitus]